MLFPGRLGVNKSTKKECNLAKNMSTGRLSQTDPLNCQDSANFPSIQARKKRKRWPNKWEPNVRSVLCLSILPPLCPFLSVFLSFFLSICLSIIPYFGPLPLPPIHIHTFWPSVGQSLYISALTQIHQIHQIQKNNQTSLACLAQYAFVCPSVDPFIYLSPTSIRPTVGWSVQPFVRPYTRPAIHESVRRSVHSFVPLRFRHCNLASVSGFFLLSFFVRRGS